MATQRRRRGTRGRAVEMIFVYLVLALMRHCPLSPALGDSLFVRVSSGLISSSLIPSRPTIANYRRFSRIPTSISRGGSSTRSRFLH